MLAFAHQKTLKLWTLRILKYFREAIERERDLLEAEVNLKLKTSHYTKSVFYFHFLIFVYFHYG